MSLRRQSRQIEIFNFSFLDIMACTIGLLIFIMVMIFVLQSGANSLQDTSQVASHLTNQISQLQQKAADDERVAAQLEEQQMHAIGADPATLRAWNESRELRDKTIEQAKDLEAEVMQLRAMIQSKQIDRKKLERSLAEAEAQLAQATKDHAAADVALSSASASVDQHHVLVHQVKVPGASTEFNVVHVDCRANEVVIMRIPLNGKAALLGSTPANQISDPRSAFQQILGRERTNDKTVIVFWVRPAGQITFDRARGSLPNGMTFGYEPAGDDWKFLN